MSSESSLKLVEQVTKLHADNKACHTEENVAPQLRMQKFNITGEPAT